MERGRLPAVVFGNDLDFQARRPGARLRDDLPATQRRGRRLRGPLPGAWEIVDMGPVDDMDKPAKTYSISDAAVGELEAQKGRAEVERFRAGLRDANACAREDAMD